MALDHLDLTADPDLHTNLDSWTWCLDVDADGEFIIDLRGCDKLTDTWSRALTPVAFGTPDFAA